MTAATLGLDTAPRRRGWHALFWVVPLAALWIALNYAFPVSWASGALMVATRLTFQVMIALGLWLGLERAELTASQRSTTWLAVMVPLTLWLAVVWSAAINGVFANVAAGSVPPILFARLIPLVIAAPILLWSRRIGQVLDAIPPSWIIPFQVVRLLGALFLLGWAHHTQPGIFAVPVGIADVLVGLFAVPIALSLASGSRESRQAAIAYNIFGLLDFSYSIPISTAISLHLIETGFASPQGGAYPGVMLPAFGVPLAFLLHVVSLRQLVRRNRAATS
jgi:hypothetical protein